MTANIYKNEVGGRSDNKTRAQAEGIFMPGLSFFIHYIHLCARLRKIIFRGRACPLSFQYLGCAPLSFFICMAISEIGKGPDICRRASNFITCTHRHRIDIQLQFVRGIFNINPARRSFLSSPSRANANIGISFLRTPEGSKNLGVSISVKTNTFNE